MSKKKRRFIRVPEVSGELIKNLYIICERLEVDISTLLKVEGKNVIKEFDKRITTNYGRKD